MSYHRWSISSCMLRHDATVRDAIKKIEEAGKEIAIVCEGRRLIGIITDSDIRRGILRGVSLDDSASKVVNTDFRYAWNDEDRDSVYLRMTRDYIKQMPVLNEQREIVDIYFLSDIGKPKKELSTPVLIMAGGMGTRLRPLTNSKPKPMLPVGGRPLLEIIIEQFRNYGFSDILLSVNYHKEVIQNYFQDGSRFNVNIRYIEEEKRMGTAGAIRLAREYLNEPFFVVNGDILTKVNFQNFFEFHQNENAVLTLATTCHAIQIPYGVVEMQGNHVVNFREKPRIDFFVNAGMYCVNPEVIHCIPENCYFDMTQLIDCLLKERYGVSSFPIHEYWMDIGQLVDYEKANEEFFNNF